MTTKASELPSAVALSFLGDAVHSLYIRRMLVARGIAKSGALNDAARDYVTAGAQARQAKKILPHLTEEERNVYRRAHNSGHLNRPKHASGADYRAATGLEAVLGMLEHTGDRGRIAALMEIALDDKNEEKQNDSED